ncbi:MAG: acyl-CoA synthetase [Bacteroidia bacterium]|jgi:malonyl-CoA/methylmalonyl-CoA synthetase|nr:acyl-CoA synthetase [Bacteroidia bacterium]
MTFLDSFSDLLVDDPARTILRDARGTFTVDDVYLTAKDIALHHLGGEDLKGAPVAIMAQPGLPYVASLLAVWLCGGMAVPLCIDHPAAELEYAITESRAQIVICQRKLLPRIPKMRVRVEETEAMRPPQETVMPLNLPYPKAGQNALMLFTSGTTGKPKGVVHTHGALYAQITVLHKAWGWTSADSILHVLPLHHTHGIVNKLLCALMIGARCDMRAGFDAADVWPGLASGHYTLFMAVPTIYAKLIAHWEAADEEKRQKWSLGAARLRLMVSGSAALPVPVLEKWKAITSHTLLERYGMTETGMVLSNPLEGKRMPGCVGTPLPGNQVRLTTENGEVLTDANVQGELQVKSPALFKEYWHRPEETNAAFTPDGWFKTGDMAERLDGIYRIAGRISIDIIKTGGYKVSALEIENAVLTYPKVAECAVIGLPDETWGERVAVAVVTKNENEDISIDELREFLLNEMAVYKVPSRIKKVTNLPKNGMGKLLKNEIRNLFDS